MPGGVSLADGIPSVVDQAVRSLESIKEARKEIHGAIEPLAGIVREADCLIGALGLVKEVDSLQTREICQKASDIMESSAVLASSMMIMGAESRHHAEPKELRPQDYQYSHLETILEQLRDSRAALESLMTRVNVGVLGSARDGYQVSRSDLLSANDMIRGVFGVDMAMYTVLQHKIYEQTDDLIVLDDADAELLGLPRRLKDRNQDWRTTVLG
ncbi:hypothetical protein VTK56DRAFT_4195 [Thermocarpiscus australiensis]